MNTSKFDNFDSHQKSKISEKRGISFFNALFWISMGIAAFLIILLIIWLIIRLA